ncbi:glycosyltransferase [Arthrobacter sp. B6]|uniref:glycosyltransferase n=1 Tax=Arthrobacter sp. B6 TaxID=1570137 RepID=UPI00083508D6|nr:glycosyltransferase [Arthrobacter sp. B6]
MDRVEQVAVVVPVHNEEQYLPRALTGIRTAVNALQANRLHVTATIVVVLDSCTDGSRGIAARFTAVDTRFRALEVDFRSVGKSRRAGVEAFLASYPRAATPPPGTPRSSRLWLANTDADSCVPVNWLIRQVELADAGADAVLGSVEPDPEGTDPEILKRWHARHPFQEHHPHVYGANFGVRGSAYELSGGFPRQRSHEDRALVEQVRRHGLMVRATDSIRVLISGRIHARAPHGFAAYLFALGLEPALAVEG